MKERLRVLMSWLDEHDIKYVLNHECSRADLKKGDVAVFADLYIKQYGIAVHVSDGNDQAFFNATKRHYKPFFVRDGETDEFIVEKMENCIAGQKSWKVVRKQAAPKRKRVRIPKTIVEKVVPVRKNKLNTEQIS